MLQDTRICFSKGLIYPISLLLFPVILLIIDSNTANAAHGSFDFIKQSPKNSYRLKELGEFYNPT